MIEGEKEKAQKSFSAHYRIQIEDEMDRNEAERLHKSLEIFDFSRPLPSKQPGIWRVYYNNCNGIEINTTVDAYIRNKREKKKYNYIMDMNTPTKLDGILRQLKL